tara:strand:- start:956 stop:1087 length:132 start_codon:yes stop_codon:yes gene_type:complete
VVLRKKISETAKKIWSFSKEIKTWKKRTVQVSFGPQLFFHIYV